MAISQRSTKAAFMQPWRGEEKSDTERDVSRLHPSRAFRVGCPDSIIMPLQSESAVFHCLCRIFLVFLQRKENYITTVNNLNNSN